VRIQVAGEKEKQHARLDAQSSCIMRFFYISVELYIMQLVRR
jgi:hypothetical protein